MFQLDLNETFPHLVHAPIVEAVIHWQARAEMPWDRQQIRRELANRFPEYPGSRLQHELRLEAHVGDDGSATQVRRDRWKGFRLQSTDGLQIVQFTRDGLVFSRLQPYEDWNRFAAEACRFWEAFVEIAGCSEVQRLGVRFINRVEIAGPDVIHDYLQEPPQCLEPLGLPMNEFFSHSTHAVPNLPIRIAVIRTIQPPGPGEDCGWGLIADIDVFTTQPIGCEDVGKYLTHLRWLKDKSFFRLFTKTAIRSFGAEE